MDQGSLAHRRARLMEPFMMGMLKPELGKDNFGLSNWRENSAESDLLVNVHNLSQVKMIELFCC